jgi:hypothetical protein
VVAWNPEGFEVLDDPPIELALRFQGPTRERFDADVGIRFRVGPIRRTRKPMGRVNDQSDVSVAGRSGPPPRCGVRSEIYLGPSQ